MTTQQQQPKTPKPADAGTGNEDTFETDISESGDDGTSVRQAEVKKEDLSEVKPSQEKGGQ
ncbi:hypothetical protein QF000_001162 [Paraburkholderia atlantica]|uniref:Uncharacterized protein n=2 Tax=Paraburkholderia atlantica TaxID=2654982 RepID=A0A6I1Q1S0_PARAM|nr:hypothetical protein [Paraburkholderia atlantica]MBB5415308.1 hypothetical protein [Paraburkholderia atlantica]MBB5424111.1 hypothetical protein [Paraburkholderia atlantica]MPW08178.1 hypothetical protein [Paraburkholderia atlantica]NUY31040.1 hypothetical protein [Paraburkholderia atlantica]